MGRRTLRRWLASLVLFGVAFGFVEAAVVVYLRALYEPIHARLHPDRQPGDLFPIIRLDQLEAEGPDARHRLQVELVRELATLVMLGAVGLAIGSCFRQAFAAFLVAFGVWDLAFYLFLKLLIDWPGSLATWDLLFLLPVPWSGPVVAPMIVACAMIASGTVVLAEEAAGRPFRPSALEWSAVCLGGLLVVFAFCWDFRNVVAGRMPRPFHWPLFGLGLGVGVAGFLRAFARQTAARRGDRDPMAGATP